MTKKHFRKHTQKSWKSPGDLYLQQFDLHTPFYKTPGRFLLIRNSSLAEPRIC